MEILNKRGADMLNIDIKIKELTKEINAIKSDARSKIYDITKEISKLEQRKISFSHGLDNVLIELGRKHVYFKFDVKHFDERCAKEALTNILNDDGDELLGRKNVWHHRYMSISPFKKLIRFEIKLIPSDRVDKTLTKRELEACYYYLTCMVNNIEFRKKEIEYLDGGLKYLDIEVD